jgi:hypothetical protein
VFLESSSRDCRAVHVCPHDGRGSSYRWSVCSCQGTGIISIVDGTVTLLANSSQCTTARSVFPLSNEDGSVTLLASCVSYQSSIGVGSGSLLSIQVNNNSMVTHTNSLTNWSQCAQPGALAIDRRTGIIYVPCGAGNTGQFLMNSPAVIALSNSSIRTLATFAQCPSAYSVTLAASSDAGIATLLYVSCWNLGIVSIAISDDSVSIVRTINASLSQCTTPRTIVVHPDNPNIIFVACEYNGITSFNVTSDTFTVLASLAFCSSPRSVFLDPQRFILFAACGLNGILVVDLTTTAVSVVAGSSVCPNCEWSFPTLTLTGIPP